ncbi:MAG: cpaB [Rhodoglobus sp.]|nr:cpaB [Rhodoglobus sp.]
MLAAIGTIVLFNYVRTADIRAANGAEIVRVYVVEDEVPAGTSGENIEQYIAVREIPAIAAVPDRVTNLRELRGLQADVILQPGEQLIMARWIDPAEIASRGEVPLPENMQALTIALPVERVVGGTVQAGDTVGVVSTAQLSETEYSRQSYHKVLVLSVQSGTAIVADEGQPNGEPVEALMVTLALTTPQVEVVAWTQQFGWVWLTLEPESADESGGRTVDWMTVFQ